MILNKFLFFTFLCITIFNVAVTVMSVIFLDYLPFTTGLDIIFAILTVISGIAWYLEVRNNKITKENS